MKDDYDGKCLAQYELGLCFSMMGSRLNYCQDYNAYTKCYSILISKYLKFHKA